MQEVLIQLQQDSPDQFDAVLKRVEELGGRALHAYRPYALIALLSAATIQEIEQTAGVASVEHDRVDRHRLDSANEQTQTILQIWNDHLQKRERSSSDDKRGLRWDAPGHLPPDPPPEIREELRRRERDAGSE